MDSAYKDLSTKDKTLFGIALPWPIKRHAFVTKLTDFSLAIEKSSSYFKPVRVYRDHTRVRLGKYVVSFVKPWIAGELLKNTLKREIPQSAFINDMGVGKVDAKFIGNNDLIKETFNQLAELASNPPPEDDEQPGYFTKEAVKLRKVLNNIIYIKGTTNCEEYKKVRQAYEFVLQKSCGVEEPINDVALRNEFESILEAADFEIRALKNDLQSH
jgi:hypothetical protein